MGGITQKFVIQSMEHLKADEATEAIGKLIINEISGGKHVLVLIGGLPGSGKTTLAESIREFCFLQNSIPLPMNEADRFFENETGYHYDNRWIKDAHEYCRSNTAKLLHDKRSCIVSNTLTSDREIHPYIELVKKADARIIFVRMNTQYKGEHGVPEEAVERMRNRMAKELTYTPDYIVEP